MPCETAVCVVMRAVISGALLLFGEKSLFRVMKSPISCPPGKLTSTRRSSALALPIRSARAVCLADSWHFFSKLRNSLFIFRLPSSLSMALLLQVAKTFQSRKSMFMPS